MTESKINLILVLLAVFLAIRTLAVFIGFQQMWHALYHIG